MSTKSICFMYLSFILWSFHYLILLEACNVPVENVQTLTFKDFMRNGDKGVIYGSCWASPQKSHTKVSLSIIKLNLPQTADLMVYRDGTPHPIQQSCGLKCFSTTNDDKVTKNMDDGKLLLRELEEEIEKTAKFLASNEIIEDRRNRKSTDFVDKELALKEKSSRLKDLVKMKFAKNKSLMEGEECKMCPTFKDSNLFELYLRLPKGLNCTENGEKCYNKPVFEIEVSLVEEKISCNDGIVVKFPSELYNQCHISHENRLQYKAKCLESSCSTKGNTLGHLRKTRHSGKYLAKRDLKMNEKYHKVSDKEFEMMLPKTSDSYSCILQLDTSVHKHLQLRINPEIASLITVFESNTSNPALQLEYCSVGVLESYWFSTEASTVLIVLHSDFGIEEESGLEITLHSCPPPPLVENAHMIYSGNDSVDYICEPGFQLFQEKDVLTCDLNETQWYGNAPSCVLPPPDSEASHSTLESSTDISTLSSNDEDIEYVPTNDTFIKSLTAVKSELQNANESSSDDYYDETEYQYSEDIFPTHFETDLNETFADANFTLQYNISKVSLNQSDDDVSFNFASEFNHTTIKIREKFRKILQSLSIEEEQFPYVIIILSVIFLILLIICILCCVLCKRRMAKAKGKFDTFQNPIYEKTMTSVPINEAHHQFTEEQKLDIEDDNETTPVMAKKAEMEDLSDSIE